MLLRILDVEDNFNYWIQGWCVACEKIIRHVETDLVTSDGKAWTSGLQEILAASTCHCYTTIQFIGFKKFMKFSKLVNFEQGKKDMITGRAEYVGKWKKLFNTYGNVKWQEGK